MIAPNLTELAKDVHDNAVAHGWYKEERTFGDIISLMHSEVSEALEEYRNNRPTVYFYSNALHNQGETETDLSLLDNEKLEGAAVELADVIIRILDYSGYANLDIDFVARLLWSEPNWSERTKTFGSFLSVLHCCLSSALTASYLGKTTVIEGNLGRIIRYIYLYFEGQDVDMTQLVLLKHQYNKTRSYKHGNKLI